MQSVHVAKPPILQSVDHPLEEPVYVSTFGASQIAERQIPCDGISPTTTTFTFRPNSNFVLDKVIFIEFPVTVTYVLSGSDCIRSLVPNSFPVANAMNTITVTINGNQLSFQPTYSKTVMEHMNISRELRRRYLSYTPYMPDNEVNFALMNARTNFSPFSTFNAIGCDQESRQMFGPVSSNQVTASGVRTLTERYLIVEPLYHPLFDLMGEEGLYNINEMKIEINWVANAADAIFSRVATVTGQTTAVSLCNEDNKQSLRLRYYTPSSLPKPTLTVPYMLHDLVPYSQDKGSLNASTRPTVEFTNTYRRNIVPEFMYIYARSRRSYNGVSEADPTKVKYDPFLRITKLNMSVNNTQGILSSASPQQLHQISVRNGLNMDFNQWYDRGGCVVILRIGKDIGSLLPGTAGQFEINLVATVQNPKPNGAYDYDNTELVAEFRTPAFLEITKDSCQIRAGFSTDQANMLLNTASEDHAVVGADELHVGEAQVAGVGGKLSFRKVGRVLRGFIRPLQAVAGIAASIPGLPPQAAMAAQTANQVLTGVGKLTGRGAKLSG